MDRLSCVTGRYQPVHEQHLELFEIALRDADHLIIAITNPDPVARQEESTSAHRHLAEANPFTYFERARLLYTALADRGRAEQTTIVPFDLTRPECWPHYVPLRARQVVRAYSDWERHKAGLLADAGYRLTMLDGDPATKVSATDIRARLAGKTATWTDMVPASIAPILTELLKERAAARIGGR
ncbi:cytidyltransferase [Saccharopolyspora gloriosae]|uniref:cytidyltransferase n=1 Tax=Saccharopolyspora gloriosae TaxID=455344 RepID=UPI001FB66A91|nr:cytidyltransferase [Saccharopolyspora gloriosae]